MNNGFFETRDTGLSGYPSRLRFEWWLIEQDVASNRSRIGFKLFGTGGTLAGAWSTLFRAYVNVAGQEWNTGRHNLYNGTVIIQGEKWISHDSAGGGWFEVFSDAAIYQNSNNSFGKASWYLPTIPRASQPSITSYPNNTPDFNLGDTITIHMNSVNGAFRHNVYFMYADKTYEVARDVQFNCVFDTSKIAEEIYKITTSKKAYSGQIKVDTLFNGNLTGSKTCHYNAHLVGVEPTFTEFACFDTNAATKAITGNDQVFIQGQSRLGVKIAKENKAETKKYASMSKYLASAFGVSVTKNYSATDDVQIDVGVVNANSNQVVSVSAIDSREFSTVVNKNIVVIPYSVPTLVLSGGRINGFDRETKIKLSGTFSRLTIGNTQKNIINSKTGVQFRIKPNGSDWEEWINKPFTIKDNTIIVEDFIIGLDSDKSYMLEAKITDSLTSISIRILVPAGSPKFFIGKDGRISIGDVPTVDKPNANRGQLEVHGDIYSNGYKLLADAPGVVKPQNIKLASNEELNNGWTEIPIGHNISLFIMTLKETPARDYHIGWDGIPVDDYPLPQNVTILTGSINAVATDAAISFNIRPGIRTLHDGSIRNVADGVWKNNYSRFVENCRVRWSGFIIAQK